MDQLADQVEGVPDGGGLVQGDDRRMREARGGQRLARRPLAVAVRAEQDPLKGDLAMQQLVVRAPDLPETAASESLEQPVATEDGALGMALIGILLAGAAPRDPPARGLRGRRGLPRAGRVN